MSTPSCQMESGLKIPCPSPRCLRPYQYVTILSTVSTISFPLDFFIAVCQYIYMICIYCFHKKTNVVNSRTHKKNPQVWRRRQCDNCKQIFTSYERPASDSIAVVSSDGSQRVFNIGTLTLSIAKAAQHNPEQARYDSYHLAQTVEIALVTKATQIPPKTKNDTPLRIPTEIIIDTTYHTLKQFDELTALQYAMQHQRITSLRRRGRPSTTTTL